MALCAGVTGFRGCGFAGWDPLGRLGRPGPRMAPGSPMAVRAGASVIRLKVRVCGAKGNLTDPSDRSDRSDPSDRSAGWLTQSHSHKVTKSCPPCGQLPLGPFRKARRHPAPGACRQEEMTV